MTRKLTHEEFERKAFKLLGENYNFASKYMGNDKTIEVKHLTCNKIWKTTPHNILSGSKCLHCSGKKKLTNEEFIIRVKNLVSDEFTFLEEYKNSKTKISVRHNKCGRIFKIAPYSFLNNGNRCEKCSGKSKKNTSDFIQEVNCLTKGEYLVVGNYNNNKTKILMKHCNCNNTWYVTPKNFLSGNRCPKCSGKEQKTTKKFKQEVLNLVGTDYFVLGDYKRNDKKIDFLHIKCKSVFGMRPSNFLSGSRCPNCFGTPKKTTEQFKKEIFENVGDEYILIDEYKTNRTKLKFQHKICGSIYAVTPTDFLHGYRCPVCNQSKGEHEINRYLKLNRYSYVRQYSNSNCKYKAPLRFDFAILDDIHNEPICLIEYDGRQHYEPIEYFGGEKSFRLQRRRDKIKDDYCESHNIPLIRIKYTEFDRIESILNEKLAQLNILPVPVSPALS